MGRPQGAQTATEHWTSRRKAAVDGGTIQLLEAKDSEGSPIATFTVITTAPNQWMSRIHNRMPAILQDDQIEQWLDPTDPLQLAELLKAPPEDFLDCYPVSKEMSSGRVDDPAFADRTGVDCFRRSDDGV